MTEGVAGTSPLEVPVLADSRWQMTFGERFALEGLLSQLRPQLAIETGTAQGGSLRRIATHASEVHAFDLVPEVVDLAGEIPNARFHIGDSAELLPRVLSGFAQEGRHVDFALVDGDHSVDGVQRDAMSIIASEACRTTVIVFHDSANDDVRAGLDALHLEAHDKVVLAMLDFVPGYLVRPEHPQYGHAIWNGLGLVILGQRPTGTAALTMDDRYSVAEVYQRARELFESRSAPTAAEHRPPVGRARRLAPVAMSAAAGATAGALFTWALDRVRS